MLNWLYREIWEDFSVVRGILVFYAVFLILVIAGVITGALPKLP